MMASPQDGRTLPRLWATVARLLGPGGCPWDQAQTLESLRSYLLEEAYEVVDAIDTGQAGPLREELGDLLFQIVFQSALAQAQGWFGLDDVVTSIVEKLERRHPHVFGDEVAADLASIGARWVEIKRREKGEQPLLNGIPSQLPGLLRALKVGQRAAQAGFDVGGTAGARVKLFEEIAEFEDALGRQDLAAAERELGDVLFSVVNWARQCALDPEAALRGAVARFSQRVARVEDIARSRGLLLVGLPPEALDALWREAKGSGPGDKPSGEADG